MIVRDKVKKNFIRLWLYKNVSNEAYEKIRDTAHESLGISVDTRKRDWSGKHFIPKSRQVTWVTLISEYNPFVTYEDLFSPSEILEPVEA